LDRREEEDRRRGRDDPEVSQCYLTRHLHYFDNRELRL
jgi:hypothetical protein